MDETIKAIQTRDGPKQIDYNALANKPTIPSLTPYRTAAAQDEIDAGKIDTDMSVTATGLAAGAAPTVSYDAANNRLSFGIPKGDTGATGAQGPQGIQGVPGQDGQDGITPTIGNNGNWYLGDTDTGKPSRGQPGQDGQPGAPGADGQDGADGYSPAVTISTVTGGHRVTITDKTHPSGQSFDVQDGEDGQDGADGAPGADGKSAYESAQDGGYTGTEAQFNADLAGVSNKQDRITALTPILSKWVIGANTSQYYEEETVEAALDDVRGIADSKYTKPSSGIPKTDLASAVQTSLGKADSAVQPETGKGLFSGNYNDLTNKPTIPTVPTNVSAFTNDAGYLTQHQSLAAYRTASAQDAIDNAQNTAISGKEDKGKITVDNFQRTVVGHEVTIVTNGVTSTFNLVGYTGGPT